MLSSLAPLEGTLFTTTKHLLPTLSLLMAFKSQSVRNLIYLATSTIAGFNSAGGFEYEVRGERVGTTNMLKITL